MFFNTQDSPLDERDYIYENVCGINKETLPDEWLAPYYPVYDQHSSMWCMAFSSTSLWQIIEYMISNGKNKIEFSKQFTMYNAKQTDNLPTIAGTTGRAICNNAIKLGFCPENLCSSTLKGELRGEIATPSQEAFTAALKHKPDAYARVSTLEGILTAIYQHGGVITSILYYSDMLHPKLGFIARPAATSKKLGCHSTALIGYSKTKEYTLNGRTYKGFLIQLNSYGESQGRFGIEYIPFACIEENWCGGILGSDDNRIFREAWVFYPKKDQVLNRYFIDHQPKEVIKDAKSVQMTFTLKSKKALVNGQAISLDAPPLIKHNVTFVPFRFIFEQLDCDVKYIPAKDGHHTIIGIDRNTAFKVSVNIGYKIGYAGSNEYTLLEPPFIKNNRTYIPLRAISEMLGCKVDYYGASKQIIISR